MANLKESFDKVATINRLELVGKLAFVVGVLFAIIGGIWGGTAAPTNDWVVLILIIAGILIGLLNITAKEAPVVLVAIIALLILSIWGNDAAFVPVTHLSQGLGENVCGVVDCFAILMAPAAIIIAVKAVIAAAKPGD
jgi:hypothetical protein